MTLSRRRLLASLISAAAVLPLVKFFPARPAAGGAGFTDGFYMVNGWILTAADVEALGLSESRTSITRPPVAARLPRV